MKKKSHTWFTRDRIIHLIIVAAFLAFITSEVTTLISDYRDTRHQNILSRQHPAASDIQVQPWMTFSYINILYDLPTEYLGNILNITDRRYPNVEIRHYARSHEIDQATLIESITTAISRYGVRP